MKIKTFTLMMLTLFVSALAFGQKAHVNLDKQQLLVKQQVLTKDLKSKQVPMAQQNVPFETGVFASTLKRAEAVTPPAGLDVEYFTLSGYHSRQEGILNRTVKVYWDGDDVYISGFSYFVPDAFIKGTFTDDTHVVFAKDQYFGTYTFSNGTAELTFGQLEYAETTAPVVDAEATYDPETNSFSFGENIIGEYYHLNGESGLTAYWLGVEITAIEGEVDLPVETPTDMVVETYSYYGYDVFEDTDVSRNIAVGFYGNEVYIQGLSTYLPEAWVKGTLENNILTLKSGQFLGTYRNTYDMWFIGYTVSGIMDVTFQYDPNTGTFELEIPYAINNYKNEVDRSVFEYCGGAIISKIVEVAGTPADPIINNMLFHPTGNILEFQLATVDIEGNGMVMDKLYYKLYYEDEMGNKNPVTFTKALYQNLENDTDEIPATFTDNWDFYDGMVYLNMEEHYLWTKVGMQTIYRGGNEEHASEIVWYTISWPIATTLPEGLSVTTYTFSGTKTSSRGSGEFERTVNVAFDGNDMYIQGLGTEANPAFGDSWIKGTKDGESYIFPKGQILGASQNGYVFLVGYDSETGDVVDAKLTLKNGVYTLDTDFIVNGDYTDRLYYYAWFDAGSIIDAQTDGIENMKSNKVDINTPMYNLAGQRVNNNFKGLIIKDGKKYIAK